MYDVKPCTFEECRATTETVIMNGISKYPGFGSSLAFSCNAHCEDHFEVSSSTQRGQ
jgi:hypothetical protein